MRISPHVPDDEVSIFPVDFLATILNTPARKAAERATNMYRDLFHTRMILLPIAEAAPGGYNFASVVLVNPMGWLDEAYLDRGLPCMLLLDPGDIVSVELEKTIGRRVRSFYKQVAISSPGGKKYKRKSSRFNFNLYKPEGE